ncbi:MAG: hypothetical protein J4F36_09685 [Nitrosopumilaceae archaeon]|nr:hypothetical protein [Nitrosopumilaceae archaeon]
MHSGLTFSACHSHQDEWSHVDVWNIEPRMEISMRELEDGTKNQNEYGTCVIRME